ncbi:MAG: hypothetical protein CSA76_01865, partial [Spirochaetales bacterium]
MLKNRKMLIAGGALVILLLAGLGVFLGIRGHRRSGMGAESEPDTDIRGNTLELARTYAENGEYQMAMDLLNGLLINNPEDT